MKKFAKLLAMVLAVSMVLTMFVGAVDYKDADQIVDEDKAAAIEAVYNAGVMMGDDKGNFNPQDGLRRSEMAKILFALASKNQQPEEYYSVIAATGFEDYAEIQNWAKSFVGYAYAAEYIVGTTDGNANANGVLCYADAAVMLLRTLGVTRDNYTVGEGEDVVYYNYLKGPKAYQNAVVAAYQEGLFTLNAEDGTTLEFANYRDAISREDVAVMINNAMNHANGGIYNVATTVNGVVIGTDTYDDEDGNEVEYFVLAGDYTEEIKTEGYDVDAVIGHEINAIVEINSADETDTLELNVIDSVYEETVTIGDIELKAVPTATTTDEEDVLNDYVSLVVKDAVVFDKANEATKYISLNGADYGELARMGSWLNGEDDFQKVSLIVNENSVFISYAPVEFFEFAEGMITEDYDDKEKVYTGEYLLDGVEFPYGNLDIVDGTWCYKQVVGDTVVDFGFVDVVSSADLDVAFNASAEDKYTVSYEGTELYNYADADKSAIWVDVMSKTEDMYAFIYNGEVLVDYKKVTGESGDPELSYVIVTDYSASVEIDEDEDGNPVYTWTTKVSALNLLGEKVDFVYEGGEQSDIAYICPVEGLAADKFLAVTMTDGEFTSVVIVDDPVYVGLYMEYEGEADFLVNYTNMEVELDDITVDGRVVKIGDTTVAGASLVVFTIGEDVIVVYDPAYEFGVFADFLPEDAE